MHTCCPFSWVYASVMSILVEVRKRLGSDWIRQLICQDGDLGS